jgi:hypothetical protein
VDIAKLSQQLAQSRKQHTPTARVSFLERMRFKGAARTVHAEEEYVLSLARLWGALISHDEAMLEYGKTRTRVKNAPHIYAAVEDEIHTERIKAREIRLDAELEAEEAAYRRAERRAKMNGGIIDVEPDPITGEYVEQEPINAASLRRTNEEQIEDFIAQKGGKANLTDQDKAHIQTLRANLEALIRDLGI